MKTILCLLALCATAFADPNYVLDPRTGKLVRNDTPFVMTPIPENGHVVDQNRKPALDQNASHSGIEVLRLALAKAKPETLVELSITQVLSVGDWFQMAGKPAKQSPTVTTFAERDTFKPEHVRITSKHQPVVTKNEDGTWTITFKP